jgi:GH15 family glucan-1,4-alpha-glucosidase
VLPPLGEYGLLGDTRTAALVSSDGAIDWLCAPHFDSDPVFGRLVGGSAAGTFRAGPASVMESVSRRYRPESTTLETTWGAGGARLTLTEGMVAELAGRLLPATLLVRRLTARGGPVDVTIDFDPRFGEARRAPRSARRDTTLVCSRGSLAIALTTSPDIRIEAGRPASVRVEPDRPLTLVLAVAHREPLVYVDPDAAWDALQADERRWRAWTEEIDADVPYRDAVVRSLLTLRLLTNTPSGAPGAAPTTSLPEELGGVRNWDYRFTWPRDASIGVGTFLGVGKQHEADMFLAWLLHASRLDRPHLPVLLTLHGKHARPERTLAGWPGYADSRPVRVGNGAADQHQLDGYGWVLDAAWLLTSSGRRLSSEAWRALRGFADRVCDRWREPDAGIS